MDNYPWFNNANLSLYLAAKDEGTSSSLHFKSQACIACIETISTTRNFTNDVTLQLKAQATSHPPRLYSTAVMARVETKKWLRADANSSNSAAYGFPIRAHVPFHHLRVEFLEVAVRQCPFGQMHPCPSFPTPSLAQEEVQLAVSPGVSCPCSRYWNSWLRDFGRARSQTSISAYSKWCFLFRRPRIFVISLESSVSS